MRNELKATEQERQGNSFEKAVHRQVSIYGVRERGEVSEKQSSRRGKRLGGSHQAAANNSSQRGRKPVNRDRERRSGSRTSIASLYILQHPFWQRGRTIR